LVGFVVRLSGDAVFSVEPGTQINKLAALGAKRKDA
jgi:hypothetical protein